MVRAVLVALASLLVVAGCGQPSSPVERQENKEGVEQATKEKSTPNPEGETTTMSTSEADAAKAAAAEQEITLEQFRALDRSKDYDHQIIMGLGACQIAKYRAENGKQAWREWREQFIGEVMESLTDEVPSIQEEMIKMGYSCTISEALADAPQR